jgi:hypothetical protein
LKRQKTVERLKVDSFSPRRHIFNDAMEDQQQTSLDNNPGVPYRTRRSLSPSPDDDYHNQPLHTNNGGLISPVSDSNGGNRARPGRITIPQHDGAAHDNEPRTALSEHGTHSWGFNSSPAQAAASQEASKEKSQAQEPTSSPAERVMEQIRQNYEQFLKEKEKERKEQRNSEDEHAMSQVFLGDSSSEGNSGSTEGY